MNRMWKEKVWEMQATAFNFPCATAFRPSVTESLKCSPGF